MRNSYESHRKTFETIPYPDLHLLFATCDVKERLARELQINITELKIRNEELIETLVIYQLARVPFEIKTFTNFSAEVVFHSSSALKKS